MTKRITGTALVLALTALLALAPAGTPAACAASSFKDTGSHWSGQVVEKAYALGLMTGYPGGLFKPEDPVSRLEAIAIVLNAMGLAEEAKKVDYKNSGIRMPQGMFWGQGYLVLAVQKGLLDKDSVPGLAFKAAIPRQEVATLVAVALDAKIKVKGDPQTLAFADAQEISLLYRQYVADVTRNNIMQGIEGNRFGPAQTMKRGQMAALMAKTVQDGWFSYTGGNIVTGTLESADVSTGAFKITGDIIRLVDSKTILYNGTKQATPAEFKVGDNVLGLAGSEARFRYLENIGGSALPGNTVPQGSELTGKIMDRLLTGGAALKIRDLSRQDHLYPLAPGVTVTQENIARNLSNLADGQYVTVTVRDGAVQSIRILLSEEVEGEVVNTISGFLVLKTGKGDTRLFSVKADIKVSKGDSQLPFTDLKNGDWVNVVSISGEARDITLLEGQTITEAEIRTVDSFYRIITVIQNSTRKEYEVETNAVITRGSEQVGIDDLAQGDRVLIKAGVNGRIYEISAVGESTRRISGEVTEIYTGSSPRIYIDYRRYNIGSTYNITRGGEKIGLEDIMIGARASLDLDREDVATAINITDDEDITVEGKVTNVEEDRDRITIEQSSGSEFTFRLESDCSFRDLTSSSSGVSDLGDIREGWEVKLYLDGGRVTSVRVTEK